MDEVFINQETDPYVIEVDGTLDLAALQLQPATVVINGSVITCTASRTETGQMVLTYSMVHYAARRAWLMCKPAKQRGHLQIFGRKFCMMLQLAAWQTRCAFLVHRLQVIILYTLMHAHLLMVISQHLVVVQCNLSASSVDVWQLHVSNLHYSMLVSRVTRASGLCCVRLESSLPSRACLYLYKSPELTSLSLCPLLAACNGVASFSCTQCNTIMSHAAFAYVPAGKHHCQNPCIDIGDGAGMTTAFADHPLQKLSSIYSLLSLCTASLPCVATALRIQVSTVSMHIC